MENKGFVVRELGEGRTEIDISHRNRILTFMHSCIGQGTFAEVGERIDAKNLQRPTYSQIVSLVHAAWQNKDNKYAQEINKRFRNNWLWGYNGILYLPGEGAYIEDQPEVINGKTPVDRSALIKILESQDKAVRFVSFGFKVGRQSARDLAKNAFVIGLADEEGAEKLAEIATDDSHEPFIHSYDNIDQETMSVPTLDKLYSGTRISAGVFSEGNKFGCAYGIKK